MALTEAYARAHLEARNVLDRTGMSPERLAAEVEKLRTLLRRHGRHTSSCARGTIGPHCDCGWSELFNNELS